MPSSTKLTFITIPMYNIIILCRILNTRLTLAEKLNSLISYMTFNNNSLLFPRSTIVKFNSFSYSVETYLSQHYKTPL